MVKDFFEDLSRPVRANKDGSQLSASSRKFLVVSNEFSNETKAYVQK